MKKTNQGFTMIELLVAISIIGLFSGLMLLNNAKIFTQAVDTKVKTFATSIPMTLSGNMVANWKLDTLISGTSPVTTTPDAWGANVATLGNGTCAPPVGTCPTVVAEASCVFGPCLSFNGSSQYIDVPLFTWPTSNFTLNMWVKPSSFGPSPSHHNRLFHFYNGSIQWQAYVNSANATLNFDTAIGTVGGQTSGLPTIGSWNCITFVKRGSSYLIYYNGKSQTIASTSAGNPVPTTQALRIGADISGTGANGYFNGLIDDVSIYDDALSISQIQNKYLAGLEKLLASGQINQTEYASRINSLNQGLASK